LRASRAQHFSSINRQVETVKEMGMICSKSKLVLAAVVFAGSLASFSTSQTFAQQAVPAPSRTILTKQDLSVPGHEGVLVISQLPPGTREPNHTHPGDLFAYVQEGTVMFHVEGQPDQHLTFGQFIFIPAEKVHYASNEGGTAPVKLLVTFFVEKGKPLTTPVSK